MLFCCLWRNIETSCHKHFVVVSRYQQTSPLTTRVSTLTRDNDIANLSASPSVCPSICLSVRYVPVFYENDDAEYLRNG